MNFLQNICELELIDSITPMNVASLLLVADNFNCELLKKACMGYCEEHPEAIVKTVAWKVMEKVQCERCGAHVAVGCRLELTLLCGFQVNPELFEEVCQM